MDERIFSAEELDRLRSDTPALDRYAHFNHGSASLPSVAVFAAEQSWIDSERRLGSLRAADHHAEELADVKGSLGRVLNAQPHQLALLDSASRSWSTAMSAAINSGRPLHIITSDLEYGANAIYTLLAANRKEVTYAIMPLRTASVPLEQLVAQALEATPPHATALVSLSVVSIAWGINVVAGDVGREIAQLVHDRDGFLFLDASHAVGQVPVDFRLLDCDVLVFPTRKWLRGPKGGGVLCVSDRALERFGAAAATDAAGAKWSGPGKVQVHTDARRFEGYEFNPGLRLGVKAACDYLLTIGGVHRVAAQNRIVRARLATRLADRLGWQSLEPASGSLTALMTYRMPVRGEKKPLINALWDAGINVAEVQPEGALWALASIGEESLLRLTPHYMTSDDDIERLANACEDYLRA